MKNIIIAISLLVTVLSFGQNANDNPLRITVDGVILPNLSYFDSGTIPDGTWLLTPKEALLFEAGLQDYLRENPDPRSPKLWEKLSEYKRQYAGVIVEGKQLIYTSFICNSFAEDNDDWQRDVLIISDGGDCFFNIMFDPAEGNYFDLYVHGEA